MTLIFNRIPDVVKVHAKFHLVAPEGFLKSSDLSFYCYVQQLKRFYFADIDNYYSTTLAN